MNANDIIMLSVAGTNGTTRAQRYVSERFNGHGQPIDSAGNIVPGKPGLDLPVGSATPPVFPQDQIAYAQGAGDVPKIQQIMLEYGAALAKWQQSQDGGSIHLRIAKAVLHWLCTYEQFATEDRPDRFILTLNNLDVTDTVLHAGNVLYSVQGTAVFGAKMVR